MGTTRKYTKEILEPLVAEATSVAGVMRLLGLRQNGGAHTHISRTIQRFGIDTSHFQPYCGGAGHYPQRRTPEQVLVVRPPDSSRERPHILKRAMLDSGVEYECAVCGNDGTWRGTELTLDVDHLDGDFLNNQLENLRFLCPNCHRQTPNYAGRSKGRFIRGSLDNGQQASSA